MNRSETTRLPLAAAALAAVLASPAALADRQLVWSDEFDGTALDTSVWTPQIGTGTFFGLPAGWGNNEFQYYTARPENIQVGGGVLRIIARAENYNGRAYTSARLRTLNGVEVQYGRIEARLKLPDAPGIWPAFWMLPTGSPYGGWAASGEIDVMESVNAPDRIYGTTHFGGEWPNNTSLGGTISDGRDFGQNFHVYAIEWEPDRIRWYVDDELYHTQVSNQWFSSAAPGNPRAPFDNPFHLLLNVAVGGNFPGPPSGSVGFPTEMVVDYVRIYEYENVQTREPFTGAALNVPGSVEAEFFDRGGQGLAYNDSDGFNEGGAFRPDEAVDLQVCSEGGFNVGWIRPGEWLEYSVDVTQPGRYQVLARVASLGAGGAFRVEREGVGLSGPVDVPVTGGWQTWTSVTGELPLLAGAQVLRLVVGADPNGEYNVNRFTFTKLGELEDANADGAVDLEDLYAFESAGSAFRDVNADGVGGDADDRAALVAALRAGEVGSMTTR